MRPLRRPKATAPRSFDEIAAAYDRRDELTQGWVSKWLAEQLDGVGWKAAVDLGCGTGRTALLLAEHYESVLAVDISLKMIEIARQKRPHPRVRYEQMGIDSVRGSFDLVLSIAVLHHVPDLDRTLAHIKSLVAPGGLAILVDPAQDPRRRWQFHWHHLLALYGELRSGVPNAWARFLAQSERGWMDHLVSDRFLTVTQFHQRYGRALPGAVITEACGLQAAIWRPPGTVQSESLS